MYTLYDGSRGDFGLRVIGAEVWGLRTKSNLRQRKRFVSRTRVAKADVEGIGISENERGECQDSLYRGEGAFGVEFQ